ncbi:MAG: rod shape-determining protein MreD [Thermoflexaceae bacterium]|nr:rod shape-determining protein MreD [Thermoflexaceae bacterium]
MKRKLCITALVIVFYCLQTTFCKTIAIASVSPNIMILIPICFGYFKGKDEGIFAGCVTGLMYDIFYTSVFGFSILAFTYVGYIAGLFQKEFDQKRMIIPMIITAMASFCYDFLIYIGGFLLFNKLDVIFYVVRIIIPGMMYTLAAMAVLFRPMYFLSGIFEKKDRRKVTEYVSGN